MEVFLYINNNIGILLLDTFILVSHCIFVGVKFLENNNNMKTLENNEHKIS